MTTFYLQCVCISSWTIEAIYQKQINIISLAAFWQLMLSKLRIDSDQCIIEWKLLRTVATLFKCNWEAYSIPYNTSGCVYRLLRISMFTFSSGKAQITGKYQSANIILPSSWIILCTLFPKVIINKLLCLRRFQNKMITPYHYDSKKNNIISFEGNLRFHPNVIFHFFFQFSCR